MRRFHRSKQNGRSIRSGFSLISNRPTPGKEPLRFSTKQNRTRILQETNENRYPLGASRHSLRSHAAGSGPSRNQIQDLQYPSRLDSHSDEQKNGSGILESGRKHFWNHYNHK